MPPNLLRMDEEGIREAAQIVNGGGVIVFPTDTLYGLGCNPFNREAVERVFTIKGKSKPLPILASRMEKVEEICYLDGKSLSLAHRFWPGRLTLVLPARVKLPASLEGDTMAIRIPGDPSTLALIEACHDFLVGTSANITGGKGPRTVQEAMDQLGSSVDLYLDGGSTLGMPSTIISIIDGGVKILREGAIPSKELL